MTANGMEENDMQTRLEKKMAALKAAGRKGIFIYITAGAPDLETTYRAVQEAEKAGADVIGVYPTVEGAVEALAGEAYVACGSITLAGAVAGILA